MAEIYKPQSPLQQGSKYLYPLTTPDQIIVDSKRRLDDVLAEVAEAQTSLETEQAAQAEALAEVEEKVEQTELHTGQHKLASYTSLTDFGLSGAVTTEAVIQAMPDWSMFVYNNSSALANYITDVPANVGNLVLVKLPARANAVYHNAGTASANAKFWAGTWQIESGWTGWKQALFGTWDSSTQTLAITM